MSATRCVMIVWRDIRLIGDVLLLVSHANFFILLVVLQVFSSVDPQSPPPGDACRDRWYIILSITIILHARPSFVVFYTRTILATSRLH